MRDATTAVLAILAILFTGCSRRVSDDEISVHLKAALYSDAALRSAALSVAVHDGEVTIGGEVPSAELQLRAFKLAYQTRGVNAIRDEMRVARTSEEARASVSGPSQENLLGSKPGEVTFRGGNSSPKPPSEKPMPPLPDPPGAELPIQSEPLPEPPPSQLWQGPPRRAWVAPNRRPDRKAAPAQPEMAVITTALPSRHETTQGAISRVNLRALGPRHLATFLQNWFGEFQHQRPPVSITLNEYSTTRAAIRQLADGKADLVVSPTSLTKEDAAQFGQQPMQVPVLVYAVVPIYNLPGISGTVNFTGNALARIFSGEIHRWNDPALVASNPRLRLPDRELLVVREGSEGESGPIWSNYLSHLHTDPAHRVPGAHLSGTNAREDTVAANMVRQTPYSLGYAPLRSALTSGVSRGAIENARGQFVEASEASLAAAAVSPSHVEEDGSISILGATQDGAYPVAAFEWIIFSRTQAVQTDTIRAWMEWVLTKAKSRPAQTGYFPLPESLSTALWQRLMKTI